MQALEHFPNLVAMFLARAEERGDAPFLWSKHDGAWAATSWRAAADAVAALAAGLRAQGLAPGDRVMIVSENRPEWLIADLAIMAAGCVSVPAYTTNTSRDHAHILSDSGARAAIVSTQKLARTLMPAAIEAPACELMIGIEPLGVGQAGGVRTVPWSMLVPGEPAGRAAIAGEAARLTRNDLACLIYTSGTGGAPRGVRHHHGAILHNVAGCIDVIAEFGVGRERFLSFLPASHAYEHTGGQYLPVGLGGEIYYSEGLEKLASNIAEVRPTVMIVVPRLFEVLRARALRALEKEGRLAQWLLAQALAAGAREQADAPAFYDTALRALLRATLIPRIRQRFGGAVKALVSGGAPLNPEVGLFFHALGLPLLQGYGQTESGPVVSVNRPSAGVKLTTVGPPLKDTEVRIADDGEILVRGELVMHGYWNDPAATAAALQDGWLHTGDVGHLDARGRLVITDRKKDLIVNDKGDNVAPQRVEGMLTIEPEIAQAMVAGDRRPHLVGLIVPDEEWANGWAARTGEAASPENPAFQRAIGAVVDRVNANLSVIEKVRRFLIADEPFTTGNGQLTPSMKIRRHKIRAAYGERLDALYRSSANSPAA